MKLIKINAEHYVIADDSEITVGDYITDKYRIWQWKDDSSLLGRQKVTHSTQPFEDAGISTSVGYIPVYDKIAPISLLEVKELIGMVDVEKKAEYSSELQEGTYTLQHKITYQHGYIDGYNQAVEDNKEKKWTDEDVISIVKKSRETGLNAEYIILSYNPKSEWEVELIDGKIKFV